MFKETRWEVIYYIINEHDDKEWHILDVFATDWNDAMVKAKDYLAQRSRVSYIYLAIEKMEEGEYE